MSCIGLVVIRELFLGAPVVFSSAGHRCRSRIRSRCTPPYFLPFGEVIHAERIPVSQSSVPDVDVSCGGIHDPRYIVVGDSLGFDKQLILRVALEHDVEQIHRLVSRVLFERNNDASDGQMRVTDLQHEFDSVLQLGCWGEDVASEAWYNPRAEVDRELGAVAVADGERDDAGADSIGCVFPGGCDLFRR